MNLKRKAVCPSKQNIGGYLGEWMKKNITFELLEFPLEEYLLPYFTSGLMIKHWSGEDFLGKYFQGLAYAYQYCTKIFPDSCMRRMIKNRMDQVICALLTFYKRENNTVILSMTDPAGEFDEEWRLFTVKYGLLILLTYYDLFGKKEVLEAAIAVGDRMLEEYDPENGKPINVEARPALEGFVELYRYTKKYKYLEFCHYIMRARVEKEFVQDVLEQKGKLYNIPACHAYTVLATYLGILELIEEEERCPDSYLLACEVAIEDIVSKRMNVVGGISTSEHFKPDGVLGGTPCDRVNEACANAYFMRVCLKLFWMTGKAKYVDYIEHTLYNVGLGCKNPRDTFFTSYYTPIQGFHWWKKIHLTTGTPCCPASMSREIARLTDVMWAKEQSALYVLLYNEAEMETEFITNKGNVLVQCHMYTDFPINGEVTLKINPEEPICFGIYLRVPAWCETYQVLLPDGTVQKGKKGEFLYLEKVWEKGDTITVSMEMTVRLLDGGESFPGYKAIARGPQVMAVDARVNNREDLDGLRIDLQRELQLYSADKQKLPDGWNGNQIYSTPMLEGIYMTPFAHTGQMKAGDRYHTFIREKDEWKIVNDTELSYEGDGWKEDMLSLDDFVFIPYHGMRPIDWLNDKCIDSCYKGTIHKTEHKGDTVNYAFCGTGIEVYGSILDFPDRKIKIPFKAEVYIDGKRVAVLSDEQHQMQRRVFHMEGLKMGQHILHIVCQEALIIDYIRYK